MFIGLIVVPATAQAEKLRIAVGLWIPPYVIKDQSRGIEFDIMKEVLASQGYEMEPVYVPLARTVLMFRQGEIDGIMSTGFEDLPGCRTKSHITYENFAITLAERNFEINSIADLKGKSIVAFQNAKNYLGDDFKKMADGNPDYREIADQRAQNKLLFKKRIDVVIADHHIFRWFSKDPTVKKYVSTDQVVTLHPLFGPSHFASVFKSQEICDAFNKGLGELRTSGRYQEIISSYDHGEVPE